MTDGVLHRPIGMLCELVQPIDSRSSLQLAAERFRIEGAAVLPVMHDGRVDGAVTEADLTAALASGLSPLAEISSVAYTQLPMLQASATGAEALRVFSERSPLALLVVDAHMNMVGTLTPSCLYPHPLRGVRPRMVGGMATPVGVHLTTGAQSAGVPQWALVLTGATMFFIFIMAAVLSAQMGDQLEKLAISPTSIEAIVAGSSMFLFMIGLRSLPLAGYHAAEHMVVHAIERGEPLEYEVVRRMPRVHPRCGTNLAVALGLFLGIFTVPWTTDDSVRLLTALLTTLFFWRPIGEFAQFWFTTRPPNRKQIEAGIRAGRELLKRYQTSPVVAASGWARLKSSGILWVIVGSSATGFVVEWVARTLGFTWLIRVF